MKRTVSFIYDALVDCNTSKCERYLLRQFGEKAARTIQLIWNAEREQEKVCINGVEYAMYEYAMPSCLAKTAIEQTRIYLSSASVQMCKPVAVTESIDFEGDVMTPSEFRKFWEDYCSYFKETKSIENISKDETLVFSDLAIVKSGDVWINLGGTKVSEEVCILNNFVLPFEIAKYSRTISLIDMKEISYKLFR